MTKEANIYRAEKMVFLISGAWKVNSIYKRMKLEGLPWLVVQLLRFHTSNVHGMSSVPGKGTKIPHVAWCSQK